MQKKKRNVNRLKSQFFDSKESLLPNRTQKATSMRNSKELLTPDARKNNQNKLKSVLEVDEAEDKSSEGSNDEEMTADLGQPMVKTYQDDFYKPRKVERMYSEVDVYGDTPS